MSLDLIRHDGLQGTRHAFFGRGGGASSGVFTGLNCGRGSSDLREVVDLNRARAAGALDIETDRLVGIHQVHSAQVVAVAGPQDAGQTADGLVTGEPGIGLAVLTADCGPVLLADTASGIIGAAHAGWRGAIGGVLEAVVDAMEDAGADRARITAILGPTIGHDAYEVGPDFAAAVTGADAASSGFLSTGRGDRLKFDLPGYILHRLQATGIGHVSWTGHCTYSTPERFYSYRRATHRGEQDYGRLISVIALG